MILAGIAQRKITPPVGAPLLGPILPSTGVHDDLFARALVLGDGERRTAIVCLDLVGLDFSVADEIRAEVRRRTGIVETLLNCSHTHSAPFTIPWSILGWAWLEGEGRPWRSDLVAKVSHAVAEAMENPRPAKLLAGRAPAQAGKNRRVPTDKGVTMKPNPDGAIVPWVDVLRVDATDDSQTLAVLFSHTAHPVIVHGASTLISADYPGFAVDAIRQRLGDDVLAMFAQGCGGNINGDPLRGGFEAAERAGVALAEAAARATRESEPLPDGELKLANRSLALPFRDLPSPEEIMPALREAEDRLAQAKAKGAQSATQLWYFQDHVLCLRDLLSKAERREHLTLRFEIHALMLGKEWLLLAMPHEVFAEYQLWVENVSPFRHNMVLAYTNGCESYVPTDKDFALGGYEAAAFPTAGAALRYRNRVALRPGIERQIKEQIRGLWTPKGPG